ncbi:MAG: ATP-binding protein, partial [Pseudomonadota bacterium]
VASSDALIVVGMDGVIVLANPSAATLLGYPLEVLVGLHVDVLVPEDVRLQHAAYRQSYGRNPQARPMAAKLELAARRGDGVEVLVEIALSPLQNQGLSFVEVSIRDVSSYPRMKLALQRARYSEYLAQLGRVAVDARDPQTLLEQLPAMAAQALEVEVARVFLLEPNRLEFRIAGGIGWLDGEAVDTHVTNQVDTLPGFVLEQGKPVVVTDYRREQRLAVSQAWLDAGLTSSLSVPLCDRGRTIGVLSVSSREVKSFGDDEVRFLELLSNLLATSLQRAQSEEALNHAQRLESVGQLTGGIAHDFNNLLTVIQGNLQVLEELPSVVNDAYGSQLVSAAVRATKRGAELTGKLLAFSRRQVLQPSSVDVNVLLNSLADMLRRTLDQHIRIEVEVPSACPPLLADPGQLESALLNIAINARDAMVDGGTLRFGAQACPALPSKVRNDLDDPSAPIDGFVAISISDTGRGMPDEVKDRAFEPFFTTKEPGRGTGLGLSTVYGFIKQSKGAISIESSLGEGTTLTLYVPRPWNKELPVVEDVVAAQRVPDGLNVLLVEDDAEVRPVVRSFLEKMGCLVTSVTSAEQALFSLDLGARFDLLLTDIALGAGMRGTELAMEAQRRYPTMPVLLMSGFSSDLLNADFESTSSWILLRKPYSRQELARAIASVLSASAAQAP